MVGLVKNIIDFVENIILLGLAKNTVCLVENVSF